ncbi:hypothetical protein PIB30_052018, partial [Stylosanthes scabra]|nr:hypothetical protein [Stylosanthes scabra]
EKNPRPAPSYLAVAPPLSVGQRHSRCLRRRLPGRKSTSYYLRSSKLTVAHFVVAHVAVAVADTVSPRVSLSLFLTHRSPLRDFNLYSLLV